MHRLLLIAFDAFCKRNRASQFHWTAISFAATLSSPYCGLTTNIILVYCCHGPVLASYQHSLDRCWTMASWRLMDHVPPQYVLEDGKNLWSAGFRKVGRTFHKMISECRPTLGLYYPAVMFAEATASSFTSISLNFLSDHIGMGSLGVGIFFMCALLAIIPGAFIGGMFTRWLNPKNSWRLALSLLMTCTAIGGFGLNRDSHTIAIYGW